jgi:predicted PurR-regulated permease PerM
MHWPLLRRGVMQTKKKNLMDKPVEQHSESKIRKRNIRLIDIAIFIAAGLAAFVFWTHDVIGCLLLIPLIIYIAANKPKSKLEKKRREELGDKSVAFFIILPIGIILLIILYFFWKLLPVIIGSWQT